MVGGFAVVEKIISAVVAEKAAGERILRLFGVDPLATVGAENIKPAVFHRFHLPSFKMVPVDPVAAVADPDS